MEPAFDTPPPITNISGSTTHAICASARPRIRACVSTISSASSSPAFAASNTSFAVTASSSRRVDFLSEAAIALPASLTTPVADVYCSRHPLFPHPHVSVYESSTHICPISPPAPFRPNSILLLIFVRSFGTVTYANGSHPFRKPDIACNFISPHIPAGR